MPRAGPRPRADPRQGDRLRRGARPADRDHEEERRTPIDQNVWGRAVETGFLEDIWNAPIEDVYAYTARPGDAARARTRSSITFDAGVPVAIDGEPVTMLEADRSS